MNLLTAKKDLTTGEIGILNIELGKRQKSKTIMWILWLFLGGIGGHRYYLGDIGYAIGMTLTLGGLGVWTLIDAFLIGKCLKQKNDIIESELINQIKSNKQQT